MRKGILGGTFDPVHYGHLLMAETCREQLDLEEVRLIPAGDPPHKPDQKITDGHARCDMVQLAVSGYPEFVVDRREIRRTGPSYTVDTLREFREQDPEHELFLIIGADSLEQFLTWRTPEEIARLATIVAVNRPTQPELTRAQVEAWVGPDIAARVQVVSMPGSDLASSDLRSKLAAGRSLRFMTPKAVEAYIQQHAIYGQTAAT